MFDPGLSAFAFVLREGVGSQDVEAGSANLRAVRSTDARERHLHARLAALQQHHFAALEELLNSVAKSYRTSVRDKDRTVEELRAIS
jgi:hypothetical protein